MDNEIKHLRKKFFLLSSAISFIVIFIMMLTLNILMQLSYKNELNTATDMVAQTAYSNAADINSELILLDDTETNENGDHIILRNPGKIKSVTLNGEISCTDENAEWYCAGGGLFFETFDSHGNMNYVHKEYKFNRDNTKITIDFTDDSNFMYEGKPVQTDISQVSQERFYVSVVWWASSSTVQTMGPDEDVTLHIESIEIQYLENVSAASFEQFNVINRNFNDIYPSGTPDTLNNYSCFYLISDKHNNLVEINCGNTLKSISDEKAREIIQSNKNTYFIDDKEYSRAVTDTDELKIHSFICDTKAEQSSHLLLLTSALSGGGVFILVLILIYFISGKAVKPISESYQKQKEFISNASHELKTPITVISASTELMEKKNGPDRITKCICAQTEKMSRLVNEMLTLTRLSASEKLLCDFREFDISRTLSNTVLYFESRLFEENKQILTDIEKNLTFKGNADKIEELAGILIDNAIKYSDEKAEIKLRLYSNKDKIILSCENPCKNFNADDIPHLFERFYRADKSHSDEKDGFGLGLSIAKEIVVLHKGTINAEYKNNIVTFNVVL
ncbi:MAG: sensor histidine kinase [Porcipelethomonas sp.]